MLNDPPPEKERKRHPLEQSPEERNPAAGQPRQMVTLHIPVVKPTLTYLLIAVNTIIFFVAFYFISPLDLDRLYDWGANNGRFVLEYGEFYRLTTAMFLHGNIAHLFFNMLSLYYVGMSVERMFGHLRFGLIYFLGGLSGSILSVLLGGRDVMSVGASGAVFAIFGAEMIYLYQHRKLLGVQGQMQLRNFVVIALMNLFIGFATTLNTGGVRIDNWGHIGGLLGGLVLAWYIGPIFIPKRHPERPNALIVEDINPLERRYQPVIAFISALLLVLILATLLMQ